MNEKGFVQDGDLLELKPKSQEIPVKKPKKDADGATVERAFDKFMALIEKILQ